MDLYFIVLLIYLWQHMLKACIDFYSDFDWPNIILFCFLFYNWKTASWRILTFTYLYTCHMLGNCYTIYRKVPWASCHGIVRPQWIIWSIKLAYIFLGSLCTLLPHLLSCCLPLTTLSWILPALCGLGLSVCDSVADYVWWKPDSWIAPVSQLDSVCDCLT